MTALLSDLEARLAKARAKVERGEKALESARLELADLETAHRVIKAMADESTALKTSNSPASMSNRQRDILSLLYDGRENSQAPAQIFEGYKLIGDGDISLDTFRTTVWRMADNDFLADGNLFRVLRDNGRYWKEKQASPPSASEGSAEFGRVAELEVPARSEQHPFRKGENVGSSPTPPSPVQNGGFADDLDDDIPF